jgi:hypothetical protein
VQAPGGAAGFEGLTRFFSDSERNRSNPRCPARWLLKPVDSAGIGNHHGVGRVDRTRIATERPRKSDPGRATSTSHRPHCPARLAPPPGRRQTRHAGPSPHDVRRERTAGRSTRRAPRQDELPRYHPGPHGSPEEENITHAPRQAARDPWRLSPAPESLPALPFASHAAPRVPDLWHLRGARGDRAGRPRGARRPGDPSG